MNRITEIETRMAQIQTELEAPDANLDELEVEVRSLKEERAKIVEQAEKRKAMLEDIAQGKIQSTIIEEHKEERKMEERTFAVESMEYRNAWLKNLQGKPLDAEERAAITATSVIPTQTLNKIVEKIEQTSAIYNLITVTHIPGNVSVPVENAKNDAAWVAMGTAATDSADSLSSISLAAYKLIKTIEITADVMAMSIPAFETFIVNALYKKMAKAIENAILNGTGTNQPTGLLKTGEITATGTFTKAAIKYKDICAIIAALPTGYNGTFVMPRALFFGEVLGMETTGGDRVVVADAQAPAKFNILGYPVVVNDYVSEDTIIFGDLSYYHLNWAKEVEITADTSVGFRSGTTVYRSMALADGKKLVADAFVKYTRATA